MTNLTGSGTQYEIEKNEGVPTCGGGGGRRGAGVVDPRLQVLQDPCQGLQAAQGHAGPRKQVPAAVGRPEANAL